MTQAFQNFLVVIFLSLFHPTMDSADSVSISVSANAKQLISRLEDATSSERSASLLELQSLARNSADIIGDIAIQRVLDFLRERGSTEEYQESLDLIYKLVKRGRDQTISKLISRIIWSNLRNVELLLDLLEHELTKV
jgi:hypothetical protein